MENNPVDNAPDTSTDNATPESNNADFGSVMTNENQDSVDNSNNGDNTPPPQQEDKPNIEYDFKYPDGMNLNDQQKTAYENHAREMGLTNEQANKMLELSHLNSQAQIEAHRTQVKTWEEQIRNDTEMGGNAFDSTIAYAKAGMEKFDEAGEIKSILNETGYGSHPAVVKFFSKLGRAHAEDKVVLGGKSDSDVPTHERMYGKYNNMQ